MVATAAIALVVGTAVLTEVLGRISTRVLWGEWRALLTAGVQLGFLVLWYGGTASVWSVMESCRHHVLDGLHLLLHQDGGVYEAVDAIMRNLDELFAEGAA